MRARGDLPVPAATRVCRQHAIVTAHAMCLPRKKRGGAEREVWGVKAGASLTSSAKRDMFYNVGRLAVPDTHRTPHAHTRRTQISYLVRRHATARGREVLGRDSWREPFRRSVVIAPGGWTPVLGLAAAHSASSGVVAPPPPARGALVGRSREWMSHPRISHPSFCRACRCCCCPCLPPGPSEGCCSDRPCPPAAEPGAALHCSCRWNPP